ncbi:MAG: hypothetical protein M3063_13110 [Actinomycetota bacterium]|nr:hypothetical protein [Actinomycetota bacterium]
MSGVWYCSTCGYEVGFRGRCHRCGQRLEPSPIPELEASAEEDEVGYRLDDWDDDARGRLIVALIDAGLAHRFEDDELVIDVGDEQRVDELVAGLTGAADDGGDGEAVDGDGLDDDAVEPDADGDGPTPEVMQLEGAAARLSVDPTDMEADGEVAEASTGVFLLDDPPWSDADTWAAVGRVTRRLMAALGSDDALEDEIRTQAGILSRLLGPIVHPDATGEGTAKEGGSTTGSQPAATSADESDADAAPVGDADAASDGDDADPGTGVEKRSETVYELGEWLPEQRAELAMLLDREGITHSWDTENLVVASDRERDVETVLDRIEAVEDPDADEEATYRALEELFAATDRLVSAPADRTRGKEVVRAVVVADGPTPVGLDDAQWWQIRQRARILADSIEHRAQTDVVLGEARTLRALLRDLV